MPGRTHPLLINGVYHIFNKTIGGKKVLESNDLCHKFINIIKYYRSSQAIMRFSNFQKLSPQLRKIYENKVNDKRTHRILILGYCLMPNHFHLLLKQIQKKGISIFLSQIQNSFTRYLNIKNQKIGPIFLPRFKSKPIQSEIQLKHVSRYIHLNPYSSGIIDDEDKIASYTWSSFHEYINPNLSLLCDTEYILTLFNKSIKKYRQFVKNNAKHQKMLEYCKYINKW